MRKRERDRAIRKALAECDPPQEGQATERARATVANAFAEREPEPVARRRARGAFLGTIAAFALGAAVLSPAGAEVREWIDDAMSPGAEDASPRLGNLPSEGSILVESKSGAWVVGSDGSRRRLGDYDLATWSPSGMFVGLTNGPEISALTPQGETRWVRPTGSDVTGLDWSTDDGDRIAYLVDGTELHVMAGDNSSDSTFEEPVSPVTPAWRPDLSETKIRRQLAYVAANNVVRVVDLDTARQTIRHRPGFEVREIEWSEDGSMLMMRGRKSIGLRYAPDIAMGWGPGSGDQGSPDDRWIEAAMSPTQPDVIAAVSRSHGRSRLQMLRQSGVGDIITVPSRVSDVTWSPDGKWIVLGLPDADQWLFVRPENGAVRAVSNIGEQFESPGEFPRIAGWCC